MTEIFTNISDNTKELANNIWTIASLQKNPVKAANFLNDTVNYLKNFNTEDEINFLQFYFNMKMEELKRDNTDSER